MATENAPLKVVTLGKVDHGKSTLVGRLLLDTGSLPEGKLEQLVAVSNRRGLELELAFAVDAFRAERDQGITIDAAHVWFKLPSGRSCTLIDAPGHEEFLKNMVTGAASADAAVLLVDAAEGLGEQSHRHALILQILGLKQIAVLVNKMDLVGYSEEVFRKIESEFSAFLARAGVATARFLPLSARAGENISGRPRAMPWYSGPTVLETLEAFSARPAPDDAPLRFALQDVYKFDERRILAGRVESGKLRVGDRLVFSPWNKVGFVKTIEAWNAPRPQAASAGQSIGVTLDAQIFVERGQIASHFEDPPLEADSFPAKVFWLGKEELSPGRSYRIKLATQDVACRIESIDRIYDVTTLGSKVAPQVRRNEIAEVRIRTASPVALDDFRAVPATGRFVLVDGFEIAGGGIISSEGIVDRRPELSGIKSTNIAFARGKVSRRERWSRIGHRGRVIWITGLPCSGKSTISIALERQLFDAGYLTYRLDGDVIRHGLSSNLGFSDSDRTEHIRRVGEVAQLFCDAGHVVIVAVISPKRADRKWVREGLRANELIEVFTDCPLEVREARDTRGLYRAAREGRVQGFTGVDAAYEPPETPDVHLPTAELSVEASVEKIREHLARLEARDAADATEPA